MVEQIGYIFELAGLEKPIILFAINFLQASQYMSGHPMYCKMQIINVQCFRPIKFLTEKNVMNGDYVWVGFDNSPDGWVLKNIFLNSTYTR